VHQAPDTGGGRRACDRGRALRADVVLGLAVAAHGVHGRDHRDRPAQHRGREVRVVEVADPLLHAGQRLRLARSSYDGTDGGAALDQGRDGAGADEDVGAGDDHGGSGGGGVGHALQPGTRLKG
jgi:hypothetical protein